MAKKIILIIGAGQIGSRHLQALKAVKSPLSIFVVDQSNESLKIAGERYDSMPAGKTVHDIEYVQELPNNTIYDIAILATTSGPRAALTRELLSKSGVKCLILEKLLFAKKNDYLSIGRLLKAKRTEAWVNCPMRMIPFYKKLKKEFDGQKITYILHGNQSGLATDLIHHLDYLAYLTGSKEFSLDAHLLDKKIRESKRKGFLEITGTLTAEFKNGGLGLFRCDAEGSTPKIIEILSPDKRYVIRESESKALVSKSPDWTWQEIAAPIPYQSQLTTVWAENLLATGKCELPTYEESARYHLLALEPLLKFLNKISKIKYTYYPFT